MTRPRLSDTERQLSDPTLAVWQRRTRRELSEEDLREIRQNAAGFFLLLQEWRARAADAEREREGASAVSGPQPTIPVAPDRASEDLRDETADES